MGIEYNYFEHIFNQPFEDESTESLLEKITRQHPYFGPAQFFQLCKQGPDTPDFNKQAAKTALYFNSPLWLNYQLDEFKSSHPRYLHTKVISILPEVDTPVIEITEHIDNHAIEPIETPEETPDLRVEKTSETSIRPEERIAPESNQPVTELQENPDILPNQQMIDHPASESISATMEVTSQLQVTAGTDESTAEEMVSPETDETASEQQTDQETPPIHLNFDKSAIETTEDSFQFQPLHTSDYFASQGIRLSEQAAGTDKFGKQLKSFTDWLKTMKKVHSTADFIKVTASAPGSEKAEIVVNELAEKSNADAEILTEAMAEVLLQQGKAKKAIEVYEKLSLQNPAKITYFAAKIEQLKES